jgi:hypothetical protein
LMSKFQPHHELEQIETIKLPGRLNRLGLTPGDFPKLIDRIPRNIFQSSFLTI